MANALYKNALTEFALGNISWKSSGGSIIKAILVDTAQYSVDIASHKYLSSIPAAARVGSPATLTIVDAADGGVCDAGDATFSGLTNAPTVEAIVLYKDTGSESTSPLIVYLDSGTGLPTPAGVNSVVVKWNDGTNKIFSLWSDA